MAGESHQVMKNITRVDDPKKRVDGYYVRLQWKGKSYSKLFSIKDHNSEEHALQHAIEWRNQKEIEIGKPRTEKFVCGISPPTRQSNTGYKGIRRVMVQHHKKGKPVGTLRPCYIVTAFDRNGKMKRTAISIEKYGEKMALELAKHRYQELSDSDSSQH